MKVYKPLPVLPEFTDERLRSPESLYGRGLAELLLTIPAEYRQAAMAETAARTIVFGSVLHPNGMWEFMMTPNGVDPWKAQCEIVAEIRKQVGLTST